MEDIPNTEPSKAICCAFNTQPEYFGKCCRNKDKSTNKTCELLDQIAYIAIKWKKSLSKHRQGKCYDLKVFKNLIYV